MLEYGFCFLIHYLFYFDNVMLPWRLDIGIFYSSTQTILDPCTSCKFYFKLSSRHRPFTSLVRHFQHIACQFPGFIEHTLYSKLLQATIWLPCSIVIHFLPATELSTVMSGQLYLAFSFLISKFSPASLSSNQCHSLSVV